MSTTTRSTVSTADPVIGDHAGLASVTPLNAEVLAAFDAAQAALAATSTSDLLVKAFALTHKMHSAEPRVRRELRQSRDMITAEILRRTDDGAA